MTQVSGWNHLCFAALVVVRNEVVWQWNWPEWRSWGCDVVVQLSVMCVIDEYCHVHMITVDAHLPSFILLMSIMEKEDII